MTRFPTYPTDILSRADALLSSKYPDGIVDPRFVEIACEAMMMEQWRDISTAPTSGTQFLAALTNDWVVIMSGHDGIKEGWDYQWWRAERLSIPYEPSHPADTDWAATHTLRAIAWQPLPAPPSSPSPGTAG